MGQTKQDDFLGRTLDGRIATAVSRLHALFDTLPDAFDAGQALDALEAIARATGGELLFELPADHPNLGETQWAVLRYQQGGEDRFVHVFFSTGDGNRWIGFDSDAPGEFAKFAHAWTDVLTHCIAGLESRRPPLRPAS